MARWKRLLIYSVTIVAVFGPWLAWETDRNLVRQWLFPIKGKISAWSTRCADQTPMWLTDLARHLPEELDSPANQIAYVDSDGRLFECVNGWVDLPIISERVTNATRFRFASLSKLVTFTGLVGTENSGSWTLLPLSQELRLLTPPKDERVSRIRISHLLNHSAGFDRKVAPDPMVLRDKKPWCPGSVEQLGHSSLQFEPGSRYAYSNLGYCLATVAFERHFGINLWEALEKEKHLSRYGIDFLDRRDSPVAFNFMHQRFYGPDFPRHFDWYALRSSMGMTGNARGLAQFAFDNRAVLAIAKSMHDPFVKCDENKPESCQDGFLERRRMDGHLIWLQRGYLYGMSALFITDPAGRILVWLGAGELSTPSEATEFVAKAFLRATLNDGP